MQLRLLSPVKWRKWRTIWHFDLMPAEKAVCIRFLPLLNSQAGTTENLLVIGTAFNFGEDYPCTGRVLLFKLEISQGDPEEEQTGNIWTGKLLFQR